MRSLNFFNLPDSSSPGPGIGSTLTRNEYQKMFLGSKVQIVRKAVYCNLTVICEVIVQTMLDPQHLRLHGLLWG
jgi:hypothetical protein